MEGATEDVVTYQVYFDQPNVDEQYLCAALSTFMQYAESTTRGYIWQSERFDLRLPNSSSIPHLSGSTHFGECVADEWLITYLLFELTRLHPELAVTIEDSDGHFLLIEAAHALPRWLNERTAENRVFVYRGELHIIPQPRHPGEVGMLPAGVPSVENALQFVFGDFPTVASPAVQSWIQRRLKCYPEEIECSRHVAHCILPLPAAHVLSVNPALVAPAVQAFYQRDPLQLRACKTMRFFPPTAPSVRCAVTFSRLLYAQLRQQKFTPHKLSLWRYPEVNSPDVRAYDIGVKLSHGLEILCAQAAPEGSASSEADENAVCSGMHWERFLKCLKQRDYFQGELEGSRLYTKLLASAKTYFVTSFGGEQTNPGSWQKSAGAKVLNILQMTPLDEEHLYQLKKQLPPADDEHWLEVSSEQLDDLLREYSAQPENMTGRTGLTDEQQLDEMVKSMNHFVHAMSGHEGVEVPSKSGKAGVNFDADIFSNALASVLNITQEGTNSPQQYLSSDDDLGDSDSESVSSDSTDCHSGSAMMKSYMASMDNELASTELAKSFDRVQPDARSTEDEAHSASSGKVELPPVNIDMNLVKNLLKSYSSQQGLAGPVSNILHSMGVSIPPDDDPKED